MINDPILIPLVIGLVEVCKRIGITSRYLPIIAIILGIGLSWIIGGGNIIISGIIVGLSSVGLFEVAKTSFLGK